MKKTVCFLFLLIFTTVSVNTAYAAEQQAFPFSIQLRTSVYCYKEPDVYARPLTLLPKQQVKVVDAEDGGWVLIDTYLGDVWIQPDNQKYYMNYIFDTYEAPGGKVLGENFLPQVTTVYEIRDGWHKIDSAGDIWVKPDLLKDDIIFGGKSWNQYADNDVYIQNTRNACELYAAASAMNSLLDGCVNHPIQLIDKVPKAVNPYEGFNPNYGMYAPPLADFINDTYPDDFFAYNATGVGVDSFKEILAMNGRLVVWLAVGKNVSTVGGVRVLQSSHTIAVVGIDDKYVYITDSSAKGGVTSMSRRSFERSFESYSPDKNQCVVITVEKNGNAMGRYLDGLLKREK